MKILLHICCAVCASACIEKLREEGNQVSGFFYNPNIHPEPEYLKRLNDLENFAKRLNFPFFIGKYDVGAWFKLTKGLEEEPEGRKRCEICFRTRLDETRRFAKQEGFDGFTTTLTVSPHKNSEAINRIGKTLAGSFFLERDFKKRDGFRRAIELSKKYRLYRQTYCGCIFSQRR
ncbi:MAG: epoxyqueuosine reductase QueH [Candidatus Omnitrophota bacterium]|nr:epoxyqueuosine reductase QueH [Candidatus Omnitrophota bacterium]